jgi:hypothetical protein
MNLHPKVLAPAQRRLLKNLGPAATGLGFYLAGGTALALQLGHRRSDDFDWFVERMQIDPLALAARLKEAGLALESTRTKRATLHGTIARVRVSFIEYPYAPLQPLLDWPEHGCRLASLEDIACMKLSAVSQRGSKRDFVDIHALCTRFKPLADLLESYRVRYQVKEVSHVLYGLSYFDDADGEKMPVTLVETDWARVKKDVTAWVKALT